MDRNARRVRMGIAGAVLVEAGLLSFATAYIDWTNKLQVELFVFSLLGYTIILLGMAALAAHMNHLTARVLQVLHETRHDR